MIVVTSLSCKHANASNQKEAVNSWQQIGECFSINCRDEIEQLKKENYEGIRFIETNKTIEHLVGKRLVLINEMIDFAISVNQDLLLINSDIVLDSFPHEFMQDGMSIFSRHDYTDHYGDSKIFQSGFDVFVIPVNFLKVFPPSIYGMGAAFWDYSIVLRFLDKGIPVYWPQGKHAYHKLHPTQYSMDEWVFIGEFFRMEFKLDRNLNMGQVATNSLIKIKSNLICL